jgi:hypothetical protein
MVDDYNFIMKNYVWEVVLRLEGKSTWLISGDYIR